MLVVCSLKGVMLNSRERYTSVNVGRESVKIFAQTATFKDELIPCCDRSVYQVFDYKYQFCTYDLMVALGGSYFNVNLSNIC